ncbi:cupin domain-containing protein [Poritiphilus flavus]|uniref:Cupin domain-containing protein n=1 Tax=Poritiphilus flavus TaxID=2697053 RepID=A0A6L9EI22_9FLAO|nr:cupin domain-containing protein [Poritiphilus flavus]NAS14444.1 cupin domain-containing protein [Poritiphilus flavus]
MKNARVFVFSLTLYSFCSLFAQDIKPKDPDARFFHLDTISSELISKDQRWVSFLKGENVLTGLYYLKAGDEDKQRPHDTDEVYYVLKGKASFTAGGKETEVSQGSVLFVKANVAHRFTNIEEDLQVLVFFDQ